MENPLHRARILVVDDDRDVRDSTCALLDAFGYEVVEAENIADALQSILAQPPDVIFTDICMPDGDGYSLLRALKTRAINVPVIVSSGGSYIAGTDPFAAALLLGAVAVVEKPFLADRLREAITQVLSSK